MRSDQKTGLNTLRSSVLFTIETPYRHLVVFSASRVTSTLGRDYVPYRQTIPEMDGFVAASMLSTEQSTATQAAAESGRPMEDSASQRSSPGSITATSLSSPRMLILWCWGPYRCLSHLWVM